MIKDLFKIPIYDISLDLENDIIKKYCLELHEQDKGRIRSNVGGWQSENLEKDSRLDELLSEILFHSDYFLRELTLDFETGITNLWININKYRDYTKEHLHPNSKLSGVYYVDVPEKSGDIIFLHPSYDLLGYDWNCKSTIGSDYVSSGKKLSPKNGTLVLFPSWLRHLVEPNMNLTDDRISISFNVY